MRSFLRSIRAIKSQIRKATSRQHELKGHLDIGGEARSRGHFQRELLQDQQRVFEACRSNIAGPQKRRFQLFSETTARNVVATSAIMNAAPVQICVFGETCSKHDRPDRPLQPPNRSTSI